MHLRRLTAIALVLPLVLLLSGCPKDPYVASMAASSDVSNVVADAISITSQLQADNLITNQEVAGIASYLGSITTLNQTFRNSVKQIHSSGVTGKAQYLAAAQTFVTNATNTETLQALRIVNPAAQKKVQIFVRAINTALTGIQTAINQAKGN